MKKYSRWPRNKEKLRVKLQKICSEIDQILAKEIPFSELNTDAGKELYKKRFKEIFSEIGYRFDSNPIINFGWKQGACVSGITINFYLKDRTGSLMHC